MAYETSSAPGLVHPVRARLFEILVARGAGHTGALGRAVPVSPATASFHLEAMTKAGLLGKVKANGGMMYYPALSSSPEYAAVTWATKSPTAAAILERFSSGRASTTEVAAEVGVTPATALSAIKRLLSAGCVNSIKEGCRVFYEAAPLPKRGRLDAGFVAFVTEKSKREGVAVVSSSYDEDDGKWARVALKYKKYETKLELAVGGDGGGEMTK